MTTAAGILFRCADKVLLLLRGDGGDQPGTWGLPAGKVEAGETDEQAALRETQEETGFTYAGPLTLLDTGSDFATYSATLPDMFTPTLNDEHTQAMWAPMGALPAPLHPGLVPLLSRLPAMDAATARTFDGNGWFEVARNPISKTGVFPYSGRQLGLTGPDADRVYQVYRPAEELADPECLESFRLLPWVDEHTMLGPTAEAMSSSAIAAELKGVHGCIGEQVFFEGDTLYGNIKAFSSTLANLIAAGKRELSAGYRCLYELVSGVVDGQHYDAVQRQIRGNHLALVEKGRMGPGVAVMDRLSFTFDAKEINMSDPTKKDGAEGGSGEMTVAQLAKVVGELAPQIASLNAAVAKLAPGAAAATVTDADKGPDATAAQSDASAPADVASVAADAKAAMDGALKQVASLSTEVATMKANGFKTVMAEIATRDALVRRLTPHVGTFDHAEKTTADVAVYGCEKLGLKPAAGSEVATLEGFLHNRPAHIPNAQAEAMDSAAGTAGDWLDKQL